MVPCEGVDQTLERYFGFTNFRSGQREALGHVLAGGDILVVMPTGHGKSLIYQLAALMLPGAALVISPLISLMKDQVDSLVRRDIPATFINSSLSSAQQNQRLAEVAAGSYKIVFVAPERLRRHPFRAALACTTLSLLVVDEAHCLSQWGHDFRPDYLHIAAARRSLGMPVILALTATATGKVQDDIIELLGLSGAKRLVTGFNRPNLSLEVLSAPDIRGKYEYLHAFLADLEGAGIIYAGTRRDTEEIADFIQEVHSLPVRYYHAGLEPEIRTEVQDAFMAGDLPLVAATNAFGMGIDRPDVRFVLHYTMPGSLEAYYQEAGRAGRDGLPARAVLIYSPKDTALHEYFIETTAPSIEELRTVHIAEHPELSELHAVVPVPPSAQRDFDPVSHLAQALAERLGIPGRLNTLVKTRQTRPQKELKSLTAKLANVAGAFALRGSVADQNLLLVDDLYDSGATLNEAARTLNLGHPASVIVLTLTKTIHADQ